MYSLYVPDRRRDYLFDPFILENERVIYPPVTLSAYADMMISTAATNNTGIGICLNHAELFLIFFPFIIFCFQFSS
jgi:hypothetical protein